MNVCRRKRARSVVAALLLSVLFLSDAVHAATGNVTYTYDALGRVSSASYDSGVIVVYSYDANGNRTARTINTNSTTGNWGSFTWGAALWQP